MGPNKGPHDPPPPFFLPLVTPDKLLLQVIKGGAPCHLYFDTEFATECNPCLNGEALLDKLLQACQRVIRCAFLMLCPTYRLLDPLLCHHDRWGEVVWLEYSWGGAGEGDRGMNREGGEGGSKPSGLPSVSLHCHPAHLQIVLIQCTISRKHHQKRCEFKLSQTRVAPAFRKLELYMVEKRY